MMTSKVLRVACAAILSLVTSGASPRQPSTASPDVTARAIDPVQRQKANVDLTEQTRIIWSNLVPTVTGFEENRFPGYNDLGALFAIGYIKGLMEGAMKAQP